LADKMEMNLTDEEKLVLYALGAPGHSPLRNKIMIQKLLFLFSNAVAGFKELLRYEPHRTGPYSETVENTLQNLIRLGMITNRTGGYRLTTEGERIFDRLVSEKCAKKLNGAPLEWVEREARIYIPHDKKEIIRVLSDFKEFLHDLSDDEILAFVYSSYPDFISESAFWENIKPRRVELAISLLKRQKVSFSKAAQVADRPAGDFERILREKKVRWRK